jgi:heat shock protein HtpX
MKEVVGMFSLNMRMYLLLTVMFGIIYAIVSMIAYGMGVANFTFYAVLTVGIMLVQYLIGPKMVEWTMKVRYVRREEYPQLFEMVEDLAKRANIPVPKIGVSPILLPNAFAYGRWLSDSRVCVTQGIVNILSYEELKAVIGHELTHIKNRDVLTITLLSVIPLILYRIAWNMLFWGNSGGDRKDRQNTMLIGIAALIFYFVTHLLVMYGSRIREYFADRGSVVLGNHPRYLASALYKLVRGSARASAFDVRSVEGIKAFFANDPARARADLGELSQIRLDGTGSIDNESLKELRNQKVQIGTGAKFAELFSTHPNMLKRIKQLSTYIKA